VEYTCDIKIGDKRILVLHGNDVPVFRKACECSEYDYIIKGHTHTFENYIRNNARILNPGCLYGGTEHSIIVLDTDNDSVDKINVEI
jgi:predicted phosphodiesterase